MIVPEVGYEVVGGGEEGFQFTDIESVFQGIFILIRVSQDSSPMHSSKQGCLLLSKRTIVQKNFKRKLNFTPPGLVFGTLSVCNSTVKVNSNEYKFFFRF